MGRPVFERDGRGGWRSTLNSIQGYGFEMDKQIENLREWIKTGNETEDFIVSYKKNCWYIT